MTTNRHILYKKDAERFFSIAQLSDIFSSLDPSAAYGVDRIKKAGMARTISQNLMLIQHKVVEETYRFTRFRQVLLSKGATSAPRVLSIPTLRDKVVLRAMLAALREAFPEAIGTPVWKIAIEIAAAIRSGAYDTILRVDIESFYPSIRHDKLLRQLRTRVRAKMLIHLLRNVLETPTSPIHDPGSSQRSRRGVPQGLPVSNALSNIYFMETDDGLTCPDPNFESLGWRYWRFVDDIIVLCRQADAEHVLSLIRTHCKTLGLKLHPSKTKTRSTQDPFEFLGYEWTDGHLRVRARTVRRLEDSLASMFARHARGAMGNDREFLFRLNARITGVTYDHKKYGWLFFFGQTEDVSQLHHLDHLIQAFMQRYKFSAPNGMAVRRFVRAHYEIKYNLRGTHYIPCLDKSMAEMRRLLRHLHGAVVDSYSDSQVEAMYTALTRNVIKEAERDLQQLS